MEQKQIISITVSVILIVAGMVGLFIYWDYRDVPVEIEMSGDSATVGEVIRMQVSGADEDGDYLWDFGDGTNATGPVVEHYYSRTGNYTVTLKEMSGGSWAVRDEAVVTVTDLNFSIPDIRIGDRATYTVTGSLNMTDPNGIMDIPMEEYSMSVVGLTLSLDGYLRMSWNLSQVYDGYGFLHDVLERDFDLDSVADGKVWAISDFGTTITTFDGDVRGGLTDGLDLDTGSSIRTDVSFDMDTTSALISGSILDGISGVLLNDNMLIPAFLYIAQESIYGQNYSMDSTEYGLPGVFAWTMVGPENIDGEAVYHFTGSVEVLPGARFDVWVGPTFDKIPRFTIIYDDNSSGNITVRFTANLVSSVRGNDPVPEDACRRDLAYHTFPAREDLETELTLQKRLVPATGSNESWFNGFTPKEAMAVGRSDPNVSAYLDNQPNSFVSEATFVNTGNGTTVWRFILVNPTNATRLLFSVVNDTGAVSVCNVSVEEVPSPTDLLVPKEIITFAQAERIVEADPTAATLYTGNNTGWSMTYLREFSGTGGSMDAAVTFLGGLPAGPVFVFHNGDTAVMVNAIDGFVFLLVL